jgi:protein-tyrosine phosphatase
MNKWRSPTAEAIFKNHLFYNVKSAGVSASARIRLSEKMIAWADLIFVMEQEHKQRIKEHYSASLKNKEIIVLDIADDYQFMDPELIEIIKQSVSPYLDHF